MWMDLLKQPALDEKYHPLVFVFSPSQLLCFGLGFLTHDTNGISKHLAARRTKFWNFSELNYEETRKTWFIFEGFEIVLMVSCLPIQSFVTPTSCS
jgi:hypothetical protein